MEDLAVTACHPNKATYKPGESVIILITLDNLSLQAMRADISASLTYLTQEVIQLSDSVELSPNSQKIHRLTWRSPSVSPRGYGVDLAVRDNTGQVLATCHTAFDVLTSWTQTPRYGFLSDFEPNRINIVETATWLTRYHINGLQFYDWMYRHDHFLTDQDPYQDPLGRCLSRTTVDELIAAAHEHNIAAMPYTAIYAASIPFYEEHLDWALYQANGQPHLLGENFLVYMDPRPDSPWVRHLLGQFNQVLQKTEFDGIHLDQYGDPKQAYDAQGQKFNLAVPLAATINATKALVRSHRPHGAVVFNAVSNWPIEVVAPSDQDFVYIEVWPPYSRFEDLHKLITQAQDFGGGKPVVLAAYIDPSLEHNARLMDAVIFASGGGHIELGERNGMLAEPYFPNYGTMTPDLAEAIRRYYDFAVRYQDVIGPRTSDTTTDYLQRIELDGISTLPGNLKDRVWPIVREGEGFLAISFINLLGVESPEWANVIDVPPTPLGPTTVRILGNDREISRIWFASPDGDDPSPQPLTCTRGNDELRNVLIFQIPLLAYWDIVVIEWRE